ncbi:hypothetical protein Ccrd_012780 [Cynara cardunculus var. scolymus]|uniref:WEB family n=1 Tax=Cynara cardunculus var. scolymus TaxID=59895 RepID=A0A103YGU4_CYNCS|nr:hypothetical protein Ccrd_012780 [Cynara cardunculus var. scolymus]
MIPQMRKSEVDCVETELSDAKKAVQDLALKIEEANSRAKGLQRKPKWRKQEEAETSLKNKEDAQYAEVMRELEHMKQELGKLKLDMARVLKEKKHAERATKAWNSKAATFSASIGLIKKEIQELGEEQALTELARMEAVKECKAIEAWRKEDADRSQILLLEAKKKPEENEMTTELQVTLSDINLLDGELNMAKEMEKMARKQEGSPLNTITDELEAAKRELASIKEEGFNFMTSMDVIRDELKHVRDETARLQKAEQKRELTVQNLNSKILRAKAKLEALTASERKSNTIASHLSVTLQQLSAEAEITKKEKDVIMEEIGNMKLESQKTESEIQLAEERLQAAMEELKAVKSSESKALDELRNLINTTEEARGMVSMNSSIIRITDFEYEYLKGTASEAAEVADKKIVAAQAWVEAVKANEREILMKVEMAEREMKESSVEAVEEEEEVEVGRRGKSWEKAVASPRRSVVYRVGNMGSAKRPKSQKLRSPAARYTSKSRRGKMMPKLRKLFSNKNIEMDD